MKFFLSLFICFALSYTAFGQDPTVQLRTMWNRPQVHVLFNGYTISFTIHDIDKALGLLYETGDHTYGRSSGLDTGRDYVVELFAGLRTEYKNPVQPLLQRAIGAFLLATGHALVQNKKHKALKEITKDKEPVLEGEDVTVYKFYDPKTGILLFYGVLPLAMYTQDIGFD